MQTVLRHVSIPPWMRRCLRIHSFDRLDMSMLRSSPKEIVATLGWIEELPYTESQLIRLLQPLQNGSSSLNMLQRWVMFSPHFFFLRTIFACCNCICFVNFRPEACPTCVANLFFFLVSMCFSTLIVSFEGHSW